MSISITRKEIDEINSKINISIGRIEGLSEMLKKKEVFKTTLDELRCVSDKLSEWQFQIYSQQIEEK